MRMKKRKNYRWKCKERDGIDSDTCVSKPNTERKACTICQHVRKYVYLSISGFIIDPKKVICWKCHDAKCDSMHEAHMRILEPNNEAWRGC